MYAAPFIEGKGFFLRELRKTDLDGSWYSWFNDSEVTKWQNKKIFPNSRERQSEYFVYLQSSKADVVLAMVDEATQTHFGNVGLHNIDWVHRSAELGIVIGDKNYWGRKFGKQAWALITNYAFRSLNLNRVYAHIMVENIASQRCAEAAGFQRQGRISEMFYKSGSYHDVYYYAILARDLGEALRQP